jgi:hypothetical protein
MLHVKRCYRRDGSGAHLLICFFERIRALVNSPYVIVPSAGDTALHLAVVKAHGQIVTCFLAQIQRTWKMDCTG